MAGRVRRGERQPAPVSLLLRFAENVRALNQPCGEEDPFTRIGDRLGSDDLPGRQRGDGCRAVYERDVPELRTLHIYSVKSSIRSASSQSLHSKAISVGEVWVTPG